MSQPLILITGATGLLGFRTLVLLLQHGYRARIAHRRPDQPGRLQNTASLQPFLAAIQFVHIPDITAADAYNEAVVGVDGILHIASPVHMGLDPGDRNWQRLFYEPAEKGTLNILAAALKEPGVRRIVMTSSVVALEPKEGSDRAGPYDVRELPDRATMDGAPDAETAYVLSKVLSHRVATKAVEAHRSYDLVRILPGYIQGANELYTSAKDLSDDKTSGSNEGIMKTALGQITQKPRTTAQVLLDDVARAHVLALHPEVAKHGDCLSICGNGGDSMPWARFLPIMERMFPDAVKKGIIDPKAEDEDVLTYFDVSGSEKALGFKFAGPEEMVVSVVGQYIELATSGR